MLEVLRRLGIFPRSCVLELTLRCNLSCRHCGSYGGRAREGELELAEWLRVADELAALMCERVTLGGGEPTLNPDWPRIGERLASRGVKVNLVSNGVAWSREDAARARDAGLENAAFSLDGLEAAHDYQRRRAGSFRLVVESLEACRAAGLATAVVTVVNRQSLEDLPALRPLLQELGVESWQVQTGPPAGALRDHPELQLAPRDLLRLVPLLAELHGLEGAPRLCVSDNIGYFGRFERALREPDDYFGFWLGCRAGLQVLGIESSGDVKGCLSLPSHGAHGGRFVEGNVRYRSLHELWCRPGAFAATREFRLDDLRGFCRSCPYAEICRGGCLWQSYACGGLPRENPFCFFRAAVEAGAHELLCDDDLAALAQRTSANASRSSGSAP